MKEKEALSMLRKLKQYLHAHYKVRKIGLFGSFVHGRQKKGSDIDVLVEFEKDADLFALVGLGLFLEDKLQQKVDVVPKNALRAELRDSILRDVVYA